MQIDGSEAMQTYSRESDVPRAGRATPAVDVPATSNASLLNFSDSPFVDDDSWAEPPRAADRRLQIAAVLLGLGVVAMGFFTLGARMGKSRAATPAVGAGVFGGRGAGGFAGAGGGGGFGGRSRALLPTVGKVTKVDGNTITMTSSDGTIVLFTLADDTSIGRRKKQGAKNIAVGDEISVRGATAADGSITATVATVGDVEPSLNPTAGTSGIGGLGAGGFGTSDGVGGSFGVPAQGDLGVPASKAAVPVQGDAGASVVTGSGSSAGAVSNDPLSATTVPTLGGLLPG